MLVALLIAILGAILFPGTMKILFAIVGLFIAVAFFGNWIVYSLVALFAGAFVLGLVAD